jgi:hypothetical protein
MLRHLTTRSTLFFLFFALFLFSFSNQLIFEYQVPAGGDAVNHNIITQTIMREPLQALNYHTAWHIIVALISSVTTIPTITVMAWLAPLLLFTMGLALYAFNRYFFGQIAGVASLILIGFFSYQPLQTLQDGGFPNVLAAGTVMPLIFIALDKLFTAQQKGRFAALFIGTLILLVFSHHIVTLYTLPIIGLLLFMELLRYLRRVGVALPLILIVLALITVAGFYGLVWLTNSPLAGSAGSLLKQFMTIQTSYPFITLIGKLENSNAIWPLEIYPNGIGEAIVYLGIGGLLVATYQAFRQRGQHQFRGYFLLIVWAVILFAGSRMAGLGFPVRLARDLAIPLALLGGVFIQTIISFILTRRLPVFLIYLFIASCVLLGALTFRDRANRTVSSNPLINHLSADAQMAQYITRYLPIGDTISILQDDIYFHSFVPIHKVNRPAVDAKLRALLDDKLQDEELAELRYVYIERRLDRAESWDNNDGIIKTFSSHPKVTLVVSFAQPEKRVYLFRVDK